MAEFETDVDLDVEDTTDDDTTDNETELTVADYHKEKARREKAEKAVVELKKQLKNKSSETTPNAITEEELAIREELSEFLAENKDLKEYKADLLKYKKQGLTFKQAKAVIENDDKTIENRKKTNSMNLTEWETSDEVKSSYTRDELSKLEWAKYDKVAKLIKAWKIKLK